MAAVRLEAAVAKVLDASLRPSGKPILVIDMFHCCLAVHEHTSTPDVLVDIYMRVSYLIRGMDFLTPWNGLSYPCAAQETPSEYFCCVVPF